MPVRQRQRQRQRQQQQQQQRHDSDRVRDRDRDRVRDRDGGRDRTETERRETLSQCPDIGARLKASVTREAGVQEQLLRVNSEYANYVPSHSQTPVVQLHPHGTPAHFPVGVKHKWTR